MSFRPLNPNFRHAALAGLVCLAFVGAARAGDGARNIEIVPFHSTSMDTNFDQPGKDDSQSFKVWQPTAPGSLAPEPQPVRMTPLPQSQPQSLSKEEQQLLDRRRNWVFMTPEDYATDSKTAKNPFAPDNGSENMTAMERYYRRLEQSGKPSVTNDFGQLSPDRMNSATNYFNSAVRNTDSGPFGQTPFNSSSEGATFQSLGGGNSASVFGGNDNNNNNSVAAQSPEEIRIQTAQKAHMENFKQLWDIDQASSAATPVVAPASTPVDVAPLFGASTPGMSAPPKANLAIAPLTPGNLVKPVMPLSQTTTPRYTPPQHSDFSPPQRPF